MTDLGKIYGYLKAAPSNPIILRQCVWFQLSIHFVTRGLKFHRQLTKTSFAFMKNENVIEHVTPRRSKVLRNYGRHKLYANGEENCPVETLKLLISKTTQIAKSLSNALPRCCQGSSEF